MKKIYLFRKLAAVLCVTVLVTACGGGKTASDEVSPSAEESSAESEAEKEADVQEEAKEENSFSLKPSPDKYTQYVGKYIGMNAATIGYTSLGGDRMLEIGAGHLQITYVTADGIYVGADDEENLKNYVVTAQSIEPNTEVKLTFQKDSDGEEYDNLVDFQSFDKIDLAVKKVGSEEENVPELVSINPAPDKYTYYIHNYVGKNLASVGYHSLGGDYRDTYGAGSVELVLVTEDGSYVDSSDESLLKHYVITGQDIAPNTEIKLTYSVDSEGNEYSNLVDSQTYEKITLNIRHLDGVDFSNNESEKDESEEEQSEAKSNTNEDSNKTSDTDTEKTEEENSGNSDGYEAIYDEYVQKLSDRTDELLEEYKSESEGESLDKKAEICNDKIEILAELSNEGVEKMAQYMITNGDYDAYSEWSGKLYDVYLEKSQVIMDEYLNNAF